MKQVCVMPGTPTKLGGACFDVRVTRYVLDATGEGILRFTPILRPGILASGSLEFPFWECGECDGAQVLAQTRARAVASAQQSLRAVSQDASPDPIAAAAPELLAALRWALTVLPDSLEPDHHAAFEAATALVERLDNSTNPQP